MVPLLVPRRCSQVTRDLLRGQPPLFVLIFIRGLTGTVRNAGNMQTSPPLLQAYVFHESREASPFSLLDLLSTPVPFGLPIPACAIEDQLW